MLFQVWQEGFRATGESSPAIFHGEVEASTFRDACIAIFKGNSTFEESTLTYWGCRLFDNETKARSSFG
jgi:hypothetical protein